MLPRLAPGTRPRPRRRAIACGLALQLSACAGALPPAQGGAPEPEPEPLPAAAVTPRLDPEVVDESYALCPSVTADASTLRFGGDERALECSRPGACRPHRKLVGASLAELHAFAGPPSRCEGDLWTYDFGRSCEVERDLLLVTIYEGEVVSARHEHAFEREACAPQDASPPAETTQPNASRPSRTAGP